MQVLVDPPSLAHIGVGNAAPQQLVHHSSGATGCTIAVTAEGRHPGSAGAVAEIVGLVVGEGDTPQPVGLLGHVAESGHAHLSHAGRCIALQCLCGIVGCLGPLFHGQIGTGTQAVGYILVDIGLALAVGAQQLDGLVQVGQDGLIHLAHSGAGIVGGIYRVVEQGHTGLVLAVGIASLEVGSQRHIGEGTQGQTLSPHVLGLLSALGQGAQQVVDHTDEGVGGHIADVGVGIAGSAAGVFRSGAEPVVAIVGTCHVGTLKVLRDGHHHKTEVIGTGIVKAGTIVLGGIAHEVEQAIETCLSTLRHGLVHLLRLLLREHAAFVNLIIDVGAGCQ